MFRGGYPESASLGKFSRPSGCVILHFFKSNHFQSMAVDASSSGGVDIPSDGGLEGKEGGIPSNAGLEGQEGVKCGAEKPSMERDDASPRKAGPGEFDLLKVIGIGAFGKVLQVR